MRRAASRIFATSLLLLGFGCASPVYARRQRRQQRLRQRRQQRLRQRRQQRLRHRRQQPRRGRQHPSGNGGSNPGTGGTHTGGGRRGRTGLYAQRQPAGHAERVLLHQRQRSGLQGAIYPYGDGMSCPYSPTAPTGHQTSARAASAASCGTTKIDSTFAAWGCGIGVELDDDGTTKHAVRRLGQLLQHHADRIERRQRGADRLHAVREPAHRCRRAVHVAPGLHQRLERARSASATRPALAGRPPRSARRRAPTARRSTCRSRSTAGSTPPVGLQRLPDQHRAGDQLAATGTGGSGGGGTSQLLARPADPAPSATSSAPRT